MPAFQVAMTHAWLDSLSEDWVSQAGSDASAVQLPPLKNEDTPTQPRGLPSRIPLRSHTTLLTNENSINILSERSANDINISRQRLSSRAHMPPGIDKPTEVPRAVSSAGSVVHNTVQHQPSPSRMRDATPEWKRRLVYGEVAYGEQRDLFVSAATGLQGMFNPPTASADQPDEEDLHEATMPSSPPGYPQRISSIDLEEHLDALDEEETDDEHPADVTPSPSPRKAQREIKYKLNGSESLRSSVSTRYQQDDTPSRPPNDRSNLGLLSADETVDPADATRKTSGQSDTRNEDFSAIVIGKQSDARGQVEFAPVDLPLDQLKHKLEHLRVNRMLTVPEESLEGAQDEPSDQEGRSKGTETTDEYAQHGGFVNVRRGGRSAEGSFRYRPLSPGFSVDTSEMLPEESLQASTPKHFPSVREEHAPAADPEPRECTSPSLPRAPFPSPDKRKVNADMGKPKGSPLKLFGPYDTFTNQTLLRRISQFEDGMSSRSPVSRDISRDQSQSPARPSSAATSRSVSVFGAGDLQGYKFQGSPSSSILDESVIANKENHAPSHRSAYLHGSPRAAAPAEGLDLMVPRRRHKSQSSVSSKHTRVASASEIYRNPYSPARGPSPRQDGSEGKRARLSPTKEPTPKRRRTLHRSDVAYEKQSRHSSMDSSHRQSFRRGNRGVLGPRHDLTPSWPSIAVGSLSPTPSTDESPSSHSSKPLVQNHSAPPATATTEIDRKPSMRTQDFVDQAAQIMAMIRSQVRPPGLESLEESVAETSNPDLEESYQDSSSEPLDRPPSRQRISVPIPVTQEDEELVKKLKKYQEFSDLGDIISSSVRAVGLAKDAQQQTEEQRPAPDGPLIVQGDIISDIPNVRISAASTELNHGSDRNFDSQSSGRSSSRNFPSASSRGSDSRRTIMPESISHLIPNRVGSMYLDEHNNVWVKKKEDAIEDPSQVPSEESDEDPFASIPDLTVDMTKEIQNLKLTTTRKESLAIDPELMESPPSPTETAKKPPGLLTLSPTTQVNPTMAVLARKELDKLELRSASEGSSMCSQSDIEDNLEYPQPNDVSPLRDANEQSQRRSQAISFSSPVASVIHDALLDGLNEMDDDPEALEWEKEQNAKTPSRSPLRNAPAKSALKTSGQATRKVRIPSRHQPAHESGFVPRPVSRIDEQDEESTVEIPFDDQRQVSVIGETSMMNHRTPNHRHTSLSVVVSDTPGQGLVPGHGEDSIMIGQNIGKLSLSPLSEFTFNNPDQSFGLEVSYVIGPHHLTTGNNSKKVMSITIRELVDRLSEAEPEQGYWEDLTKLNLRDKRLSSLHMLEEFCNKVTTLDASQNSLGHLDGVPMSVRHLDISHNALTELTSWDHLCNLQYVDVSGNELTSLSALKNLVHLRSIKADKNQLTSLDSLDGHEGLLSLRARDNLIEELDGTMVRFERLCELDLEGNQVKTVRNIHRIPTLANLNLGRNRLDALITKQPCHQIRQLDLSDNDLSELDLQYFPGLQSLNADRNQLNQLTSLASARRLDSLSLREQRVEQFLDLSFLSAACEVRKLFLSGNRLGRFEPEVDFLNLQLLELSNCGLEALPSNIGQLMPNLRTLNMNFNALKDISALRFVPRMKKLLIAGNRLSDSTSMMEVLTDFPHMTRLDVRDNPVSLGFYPSSRMLVTTDGSAYVDPFTLPDADVEKDAAFAQRLDDGTRLRRRLHQVCFSASCKRLKMLDGLRIKRSSVLARDEILEQLMMDGLVPDWQADDPSAIMDMEAPERVMDTEPAETTM